MTPDQRMLRVLSAVLHSSPPFVSKAAICHCPCHKDGSEEECDGCWQYVEALGEAAL